tara:strand:+ start:6589 stop:6843 length:255 start_codon:yes stop_codon:yes gene_type:complete
MRKAKTKMRKYPHRENLFYPARTSVRGGLVNTNDGSAFFVLALSMLFFLGFGILSVITKGEKNDERTKKTHKENNISEIINISK